ncbi:MAG: hypothetical protein AMXMBFR84_48930 [Candidatus Hydrogenedentota bacterium]
MKILTSYTCKFALVALVLGATGCPFAPNSGNPGGPSLFVTPTGINFGDTLVTETISISNSEAGVLTWAIPLLPSWLSASAMQGTTPVGPSVVTLTANRTGLAPGVYTEQFTIFSNGGSQIVNVSIEVSGPDPGPGLNVTPTPLEFGTTTLSLPLTVRNNGTGSLDWQATENLTWLTLSQSNGTATPTAAQITVSVDRTGQAPGPLTGTITFSSTAGDVVITVNATVPGPVPQLNVTPTTLEFGAELLEVTFAIRNTGTGTLNWNLAESLPWLTLSTASGTTTTEVDSITATISRAGLPQGLTTGQISVTSDGGDTTLTANVTVAADALVVTPTLLDFATNVANRVFTVSNPGIGNVNWNIPTALPAWLTIVPLNGTVTNGDSDAVLVTVDRTGLPPQQLQQIIQVQATINGQLQSIDVTIRATVANVPVLSVVTGQVNNSGEPLAAVGDQATTFQFTVGNTGTGTLNWNINNSQFPSWLTIAPLAGVRQAGQTQTVTITVNRTGLPPGGYLHLARVTSNGGSVNLDITMQVPLRPAIGVDPTTIDLGLNDSTSAFAVANVGDPGTILNFLVTSDRNWLFNSPDTGTSIGVAGPIKDFQGVNVSVDRGGLNGTGATGTFTIVALDSQGNVIPDIVPATVTVSVEASPLSFQTPLVRMRIPSLMRYTFTMRNIQDDSFLADPAVLPFAAFRLFEKGIQVEEPNETTKVLRVQNSTLSQALGINFRTDLRVKAVLMLDYSGSMRTAAQNLSTTIQDLYELVGAGFINDFFSLFATSEPGFVQMALMEFHDRNQNASLQHPFDNDPAALITAIQNINITDFGATELLPAALLGAQEIVDADTPLIPFDDADVRVVIMLTDGRLTTPPGEIQDAIDILGGIRVSILPVGFGFDVNHEPLARLADGTGGHYYLVQPAAGGVPSIPNFQTRLTDVANDVASHMVLHYVTLGEEESVSVRFDAAFDDPNDAPDQGFIQGILEEQDVNLLAITGDISMGQVSLRAAGDVAGGTFATVRAEYVPRNVNKFEFDVTSALPFAVALVPLNEGGVVSDWTLTTTPIAGGFTVRLDAPTPADVLDYGAYGDLVRLTFAALPALVSLDVDNTIYGVDAEPKYFISPEQVDVAATPTLAPAFPTPLVTPLSISFGTATNSANFTVRNIGGSFPKAPTPSTVHLNWLVQSQPAFIRSVTPDSGQVATNLEQDTALVVADRTLDPGSYTGIIRLQYNGGTLNIGGFVDILVSIQIQPPVLAVSTNNINLGNVPQGGGDVTANFDISNTGQSSLQFQIDLSGLPPWVIDVTPSTDTVTSTHTTVVVTIDPALAPLGNQSFSLPIVSNGGTDSVTIQLNVT